MFAITYKILNVFNNKIIHPENLEIDDYLYLSIFLITIVIGILTKINTV